ncbi:MAG: DNA repair protein RadC [Bacteroidota bacterium]|jgi:DNA repair protein RadC|nr:DNA repair protein RadC [Bacteroidota bacterium]
MQYEYASTVDLVREITGRCFHDLPSLRDIRRNPDVLLGIDGIGAVSAKRIQAALELGIRYATEPATEQPVITSPEDIILIYGPRLRDLEHERFYVLLMNNAGVITDEVMVSKGIQNSTLVHPREIFREAIRRSASSVILMHNHPSGIREASHEDKIITKQLVEAGRLLDIQVKDHIIICGQSYLSFAENGWLEE